MPLNAKMLALAYPDLWETASAAERPVKEIIPWAANFEAAVADGWHNVADGPIWREILGGGNVPKWQKRQETAEVSRGQNTNITTISTLPPAQAETISFQAEDVSVQPIKDVISDKTESLPENLKAAASHADAISDFISSGKLADSDKAAEINYAQNASGISPTNSPLVSHCRYKTQGNPHTSGTQLLYNPTRYSSAKAALDALTRLISYEDGELYPVTKKPAGEPLAADLELPAPGAAEKAAIDALIEGAKETLGPKAWPILCAHRNKFPDLDAVNWYIWHLQQLTGRRVPTLANQSRPIRLVYPPP